MNGAGKTPVEQDSVPRGSGARPVGAVRSAIRILRHLSMAPTAQGATDIARAVGMYPGTCYQVLRTLLSDDLVTFDPAAKTYAASAGLTALADRTNEDEAPRNRRRECMESLSSDYGATVYLIGRMREDKGILLDFVHPRAHAKYPIILSWDNLYVGAIGRLATFYLDVPRRRWRSLFDAMDWQDPPSYSAWEADVKAVRRLGYAADRGHVNRGLTVVAAPMFDTFRELAYFLVLLYRESQVDEEKLRRAAGDLRIAAERIRHELVMQGLGAPHS